ncbi:MAG: glucan ABC transporter ATP-binding protein/ permease [Hyphomicrobiaceae bacterium]
MTLLEIYTRAAKMLAGEKALALCLALASVIIAMVQLAEPILFGWVVDALASQKSTFNLIGLWALLGLFGILANVLVSIFADRLAHRNKLVAMNNAFERAMTLPLNYHADRGSGAVISTILWGTERLFWLWLSVLRTNVTAIAGVLLLIPTAISVDLRMSTILAVLALIYVVMSLYVMRKTSSGQAEVEKQRQGVSGRVGDVIGNVTVVQSFSRLAAEVDAMRTLMGNLLAAQYPVLTWWGILTVLQRAAATIAMVVIFAVGAFLASRGELSVGEIVSFVAFANLLITKLDAISGFVMQLHQGAPALKNFFNLLDETSEISERPNAIQLPLPVQGHIIYDDVTFVFPDKAAGIYDVSFEAKPGQTVALVGPTGAGKTTALALLQHLRTPQSGSIRIDGNDIRDIKLNSLRQAIAVVFQDAGLFNRSVAENISVGRGDATPDDIKRAAQLAEADAFISSKQGDYEFVIGERGASLSGGERQRIALARAILKNAPILILDEATSALDTATEARIKRAIDRLRKNRTTFIIAHRLSTVIDADQILVMNNGRIVERGTFDQLKSNKQGLFAQMLEEGGFTQPSEDETQQT